MSEVRFKEGGSTDPSVRADHIEEELNVTKPELEGLRALVLGGTGLIGSHIVAALLRRGCAVRVLTRRPESAVGLPDPGVELVGGDLSDPDSLIRALDSCDLLFHAAAPYPSRHLGMAQTIRNAVSSTERLLSICRESTAPGLLSYPARRTQQAAIEQAEMAARVARSQPERRGDLHRLVRDAVLLSQAEEGHLNASLHPPLAESRNLRGLKRIVYTSSVTTIGHPRGLEPGLPNARHATEADRYDLAPDPSPYFRCKRLMEAAVVRHANEGLPATIVNPTFVVDRGDTHLTSGRLLVPVANGRMPFYLPGWTNVVAGSDVGEGTVLAALRGRTGQRYILGGEELRLREFLRMVAVEAGVSPPRIPIPLWAAEPLSLFTEAVAAARGSDWALLPTHGIRMLRHTPRVDSSLAARELGLRATSVREAVRRALAWYREIGIVKPPTV